ncbi:MAG: DNA-formamidopyrimidine glycosylase family protein [Thermomicrobiales bacterium]
MPELPEVETMRGIVARELTGRELASTHLTLPKLMRDSPLPDLELLVGSTLIGTDRRAKVMVTHWSNYFSVLTHFKLSGQLTVIRPDGTRVMAGHPVPGPEGPLPHKSTHLTLTFTDGSVLYYNDLRQFGWWRLMPADDVPAALAAFNFAAEGVGADRISVDDLGAKLARRRIPLKQALLDQTVVAGLGNIYVDEALHHARLHPERPANSLSPDELVTIHEAISWSLERGLEQGGADIRNNKAHPRDGFPAIHARKGEPCTTCGSEILKIVVGTRGTYYCPVCQPTPRA